MKTCQVLPCLFESAGRAGARITAVTVHDPTLTTQPIILKTLVGDLLDGLR